MQFLHIYYHIFQQTEKISNWRKISRPICFPADSISVPPPNLKTDSIYAQPLYLPFCKKDSSSHEMSVISRASSLLVLPLFLLFLFPLHHGPFHQPFHVLIPSIPQNRTLLSHELLPIPQTSAISEDITTNHLPSFNTTTHTNTSEVSQGFIDGHLSVFNISATDTNTSHAATVNKVSGRTQKKKKTTLALMSMWFWLVEDFMIFHA